MPSAPEKITGRFANTVDVSKEQRFATIANHRFQGKQPFAKTAQKKFKLYRQPNCSPPHQSFLTLPNSIYTLRPPPLLLKNSRRRTGFTRRLMGVELAGHRRCGAGRDSQTRRQCYFAIIVALRLHESETVAFPLFTQPPDYALASI